MEKKCKKITNLFLTIPGQFPGLRARHVTASPRPSDRANGWPRSCVFRMFCKKTLELQRNQPAVLCPLSPKCFENPPPHSSPTVPRRASSLASSASPHELELRALRPPPRLAPAPTSAASLQLRPPPHLSSFGLPLARHASPPRRSPRSSSGPLPASPACRASPPHLSISGLPLACRASPPCLRPPPARRASLAGVPSPLRAVPSRR